MAIVPFWDEYPEIAFDRDALKKPRARNPWDVVFLKVKDDELDFGGICDVSVVSHHKIDIVTKADTSGHVLINGGMAPSDITIKITIWTQSQWVKFQKTAQTLCLYRRPNPVALSYQTGFTDSKHTQTNTKGFELGTVSNTTVDAIEVEHPKFALANIDKITVKSTSDPVEDSGNPGVRVVTITAVSYSPVIDPIHLGGGKLSQTQKKKPAKVGPPVPINWDLGKGAPTPSNAASSAPPSVTDLNGYAKR